MNMDWQVPPASPSSYIAKKVLRLEIPVYSYPNVSNIQCVSALCDIDV